jgi:hypothetical protein
MSKTWKGKRDKVGKENLTGDVQRSPYINLSRLEK